MQEHQSTSTYQRHRRSDRLAAQRAAESRVPPTPDQPQPAQQERVRKTPPKQPTAVPHAAARRPEPTKKRPWELEQPEEWTDRIRIVRYDETDAEVTPEVHQPCEMLASNLSIRLAATLASFVSLFALFLLFAERSSRALRHYALQSVALTGIHLAGGLLVLTISWVLGAVPLLGYVTRLICILLYLGLGAALLVLRVRLMFFAWRGYRWDVPVLGRWLQRFI